MAHPFQSRAENVAVGPRLRTDDQQVPVSFFLHIAEDRLNPKLQRREKGHEIIRVQRRQFLGTDRQGRDQRKPLKLGQGTPGGNIA